MVVTKDELLKQIKEALGDKLSSDEGISLIENVTDTIGSLGDTDKIDALNKEIETLKETVKTTEETWRNKYTERFYSGTDDKKKVDDPSVNLIPPKDSEEDEAPQTFEDLFSDKKGD